MHNKPFRQITTLFLAIFFLLTCNTADQPDKPIAPGPQFASEKIKDSFKQVMAIHDEVMPFISNMKRDKRKLMAIDTEGKNQEEVQQIQEAIRQLAIGDSLMFDWMGDFKTPTPDSPENIAIPYLLAEKEKITSVNVQMKTAIKEANNILASTKKD